MLILQLAVQPNARRNEIVGLHAAYLKVRLQVRAVDGHANEALIEFLAQCFGIPRAQVALVRGRSSRFKAVSVRSPTRFPLSIAALIERERTGFSLGTGITRD